MLAGFQTEFSVYAVWVAMVALIISLLSLTIPLLPMKQAPNSQVSISPDKTATRVQETTSNAHR
jgi:hypothetical protein